MILISLALSLTQADIRQADRNWTMFHGQLLEVLHASDHESLAIGLHALFRFDINGKVLASSTAIHGYGAKLIGDPETGTFALDWPEGPPHYDYIHRCNVVLQSLKVVPTTFYKAYQVGPEGALVTGIKLGGMTEFNYPQDEVVMIDPVTGKARWRVGKAIDAHFSNTGVELLRNGHWELRNLQSGKLIYRRPK